MTKPMEVQNWEERCIEIARMADKGKDREYGKALATLSLDIEKAIENQRTQALQEGREEMLKEVCDLINKTKDDTEKLTNVVKYLNNPNLRKEK